MPSKRPIRRRYKVSTYFSGTQLVRFRQMCEFEELALSEALKKGADRLIAESEARRVSNTLAMPSIGKIPDEEFRLGAEDKEKERLKEIAITEAEAFND